MSNNVYLALIHYPVTNRENETIGSALTTIDLHDIARAAMTFGATGFYVVTPYEDQQTLARKIIEHWTDGVGGQVNPYRKAALEKIDVTASFDEVLERIEKEHNTGVKSIATSAKMHRKAISTDRLKTEMKNDAAHVIAFGTAWGLADDFIEACDFILEPIQGPRTYNHLSVRSAASIYLDRMCNS
ncbi:MAG: RNA methyltransferase [Desulfobacteraceae bacterium]|nr:MAG: RNA methyltransferase [Desulfobacteraceae bacterium]